MALPTLFTSLVALATCANVIVLCGLAALQVCGEGGRAGQLAARRGAAQHWASGAPGQVLAWQRGLRTRTNLAQPAICPALHAQNICHTGALLVPTSVLTCSKAFRFVSCAPARPRPAL